MPFDSFCDIGHPGLAIEEGWFTPSASTPASGSSTPIAQSFWADPGCSVTMASNEPITYVASIIPGTVLAVRAYRQPPGTGARQLTDVPAAFYTIKSTTYGTITAVEIVLNQALSNLNSIYTDSSGTQSWTGDGWEDDLYITFQSAYTNIVNVIEYLLATYSDLTPDTASFDHVRTKLAPFPPNFPILDKKNILAVLQEIAFQSRCAFVDCR